MKRATILVVLLLLTIANQPRTIAQQSDVITAIAWNDAGTLLAIGYWGGKIELVDYHTQQVIKALTIDENQVIELAWNPDNNRIAFSGYGSLGVWNTYINRNFTIPIDEHDIMWGISWSKDGTKLISGRSGAISRPTLNVWDGTTGTRLLGRDVGGILDLSISEDGLVVAVGLTPTELYFLNSTTFDQIQQTQNIPVEFGLTKLVWSPDGHRIATGDLGGVIRIWDISHALSQGYPLLIIFQGSSSEAWYFNEKRGIQVLKKRVMALQFSPDNVHLSAIAGDGTLRTWNVETGALVMDRNLGYRVSVAEFSPDRTRLVVVQEGVSGRALNFIGDVLPTPTATPTPTPTPR